MSVFENTKVFDDVAGEAIQAYPLSAGAHARLLQLSENATYLVEDAHGAPEGILRVGRPGYHTLDEYRSEMAWLRQINDYTPLIVANPLRAADGSDIQIVHAGDGDDYFCVMYEFLTGTAPDENDEAAAKQGIEKWWRYLSWRCKFCKSTK